MGLTRREFLENGLGTISVLGFSLVKLPGLGQRTDELGWMRRANAYRLLGNTQEEAACRRKAAELAAR